MSLAKSIAALPFLWLCATAIPAGPGYWPNGTSSEIVEGDFNAAAYGLIDNYDGTNWLNMFDVQAVSKSFDQKKSANIRQIADPTRASY
jgi:hypothetical protein